MFPSILSPSVNKSSVEARAFLLHRQESLSQTLFPMKDDEDTKDPQNRSNVGHYRNLILQFYELPQYGQNPIPSLLGWEIFAVSLVGTSFKLADGSFTLGEDSGCTCNKKEIVAYSALIDGLEFLLKNRVTAKTLLIESDSKIVINQMIGAAQVRDPNLVNMYGVAKKLENALKYNGACRNIHLQHTSF
jgi:Reverse transcriptase-like